MRESETPTDSMSQKSGRLFHLKDLNIKNDMFSCQWMIEIRNSGVV